MSNIENPISRESTPNELFAGILAKVEYACVVEIVACCVDADCAGNHQDAVDEYGNPVDVAERRGVVI